MTPAMRRVNLVAHVVSSVAWIGAIVSFLVLSIVGLTSPKPDVIRAAYVAMDLVGGYVIVPLALVALATGLIQSLGTEWRLFRYFWVVVKLVLTIGASALLLLHQYTAVAAAARRVLGAGPRGLVDAGAFGTQLVGDASLAIVVLVTATVLAIYKPWGLITRAPWPRSLTVLLAVLAALTLGFGLMHHAGMNHHH